MAVASNADEYVVGRINIFFPANNNTPNDGNLTGQCVTLLKWFFAEMCDNFPSPFAARGDARYVGQTLVAQGLAVEVPYSERRRGDVICYEFGQYGHIASQLSGGRVFEENVNWSGVARRLVDGAYVYASRIGNENESWRADKNPHVYRLKGYNEGGNGMSTIATSDIVDSLAHAYLNDSIASNPGLSFYVGQPVENVIAAFNGSEQRAKYLKWLETVNWIADTRGQRLDNIAQLVGVENEDQYDDIIAAINKLKAGATGDTFEPVTEQLFKKKAK
jgi:hypothetical protein